MTKKKENLRIFSSEDAKSLNGFHNCVILFKASKKSSFHAYMTALIQLYTSTYAKLSIAAINFALYSHDRKL